MGLDKFLSLAYDTYTNLTKEFLASLKIHANKLRNYEWDDLAYIEFTVGEKKYKMSYKEISAIYGLSTGLHICIDKSINEPLLVCKTIGVCSNVKGLTKATNIRHPAIMYVHEALAHTLYARRETRAIPCPHLVC